MRIFFWRKDGIGYSYSNSEGILGGLITLWKEDAVSVLNSFWSDVYMGIKVVWLEDVYYIFKIYSSCDLQRKKAFWKALLDLKHKYVDGECVIRWDFNTIKNRRERKGRSRIKNSVDMKPFGDFIEDCNLLDVPFKGKLFSWYNGDS